MSAALAGLIGTCAAALEIQDNSWLAKYDQTLTQENVQEISRNGKMPEDSIPFKLDKNTANLKRVLGIKQKLDYKKDRAVVSCIVKAESDQNAAIGIGTDWWMTCYVNGELIGTTEPIGNYFYPFSPDNHIYPVKFRKGENHIAFHLRPGGSWMFTFSLMPGTDLWPERYEDKIKVFNKLFPAPDSFRLQKKPYLTHVSSTGAKISAEFDAETAAFIKIFEKEQMIREFWSMTHGMKTKQKLHQFDIDGLKPDTEYRYEIHRLNQSTAKTIKAANGTFTTFPATGMDHTFVLISDTQVESGIRKKVITQMTKLAPESLFAAHLGDFSNSMDDVQETCFDTNLNLLNGIPFVPVRGNHEYRGEKTEEYSKYFGRPYYSFRVGDVFYIVLDVGEDKAPVIEPDHYTLRTDTDEYFRQQGEWVKQIIQSEDCKTAKRRIVLAHCPPFQFASKFFSSRLQILTAGVFWGKDPACKIDLWLCGHTHNGARFDPVSNAFSSASWKKRLSGWDLENILFPVYVNDGPGNGGAEISALVIQNDETGINIIYHSLHGEKMVDNIRIEPGKPFIIKESNFKMPAVPIQ